MRRAISTSPSRVSSGTVPISRRYMRTGSLIFSPPSADRQFQIEKLFGLLELLFEILGLFQDLDAGAVQAGEDLVEFRPAVDLAGQNFAHLVVQNVALLLAHLHEPLESIEFIVKRH